MTENPSICPSLQSSLETLQLLKEEFHIAYDLAVSSQKPDDIKKAQNLKHSLETKTQELQKEVNRLEVEQVYDLKAQYENQVTLLKTTGFIETRILTNETGKEQEVCFMTDIHHNQYPVPSYETLVERLSSEQKELLRTKADQGFKKFLLVPFGMSLDAMISKFRAYLLEYKRNNSAFARLNPAQQDSSDKPDLDPVLVWTGEYTEAGVDDTLVYDPDLFDQERHNGVTKSQILESQKADPQETAPGWRVLLLQGARDGAGFKEIPREGKGEIQGQQLLRKDIEAGKSAMEYLAQELAASQDPSSPYHGESGMTPEEWIVMFMTHLQETGKPMDDLNKISTTTCLTGAYFVSSGRVPSVLWYRGDHQFCLNAHDQDDVSEHVGVRCVVRV